MSHLIDVSNNRANMAYVGKLPWHGLGEKLDPQADLETWRKAAGLDWTIEGSSVVYRTGTNDFTGKAIVGTVDNQQVLYRSDTKSPLGIVSKNRFNVVQPAEVLEFYSDLVGVDGNYQLETAGCLDDGKKIWALAKYKNDINLAGDMISPYLLLATGNDGTMATVGQFTTVRVVCNNTLQLSLGMKSNNGFSVRHSSVFDADAMKDKLGLISAGVESFAMNADHLASQAMSDTSAVNYFAELYATKDKQGLVTNERTLEKVVNKLMRLYKAGPGADLVSAKGTSWGALNAVTRYVDHESTARSTNNRFSSGQFGAGAALKAKAVELALAA